MVESAHGYCRLSFNGVWKWSPLLLRLFPQWKAGRQQWDDTWRLSFNPNTSLGNCSIDYKYTLYWSYGEVGENLEKSRKITPNRKKYGSKYFRFLQCARKNLPNKNSLTLSICFRFKKNRLYCSQNSPETHHCSYRVSEKEKDDSYGTWTMEQLTDEQKLVRAQYR